MGSGIHEVQTSMQAADAVMNGGYQTDVDGGGKL